MPPRPVLQTRRRCFDAAAFVRSRSVTNSAVATLPREIEAAVSSGDFGELGGFLLDSWMTLHATLAVAYRLKAGFYGVYEAKTRGEAEQRYAAGQRKSRWRKPAAVQQRVVQEVE